MKVRDLKKELYLKAQSNSLEEADLEVRLILSISTGLDAIGQIMESEREVTAEEKKKAFELLDKRLQGIPEAYLSGVKEFYGLEFNVNENVLIPQPDTEILVETAIGVVSKLENPKVLDLCTGSGCIGTSIKCNVPSAKVSLSDISEKALDVAKGNYERLVGEKSECGLGDLFEPWKGRRFDMIATNPPYVTEAWYEDVSMEVKNEPVLALIDYAEDGLDIIRRIIREAPKYLEKNGALIIESDYRQCRAIRDIMQDTGYHNIETKKDLAGRERCTIGFLF